MASFWIRPEYVVDYRPILDAPVDAAGEVLYFSCCIVVDVFFDFVQVR